MKVKILGKNGPKVVDLNRRKAIRNYCLWCMNGQHAELSRYSSTDCSLFPYRKSKTDRSTEIKSLPKKGHIESCFEGKTEKADL